MNNKIKFGSSSELFMLSILRALNSIVIEKREKEIFFTNVKARN